MRKPRSEVNLMVVGNIYGTLFLWVFFWTEISVKTYK